MQMILAVLTVDMYLPASGSLKNKRMVIKSLKDKIRNKFNVSIAEVDFQDKWQRAKLGIVQVGTDYNYIQKNMDNIFNIIDNNGEAQVIGHSFEFI